VDDLVGRIRATAGCWQVHGGSSLVFQLNDSVGGSG
jgi:hypothetical protein